MKKVLFFVFLLFIYVSFSSPSWIYLSWDKYTNSNADSISIGINPLSETNNYSIYSTVDKNATNTIVSNLLSQRFYSFAVKAVSSNGNQSPWSSPAFYYTSTNVELKTVPSLVFVGTEISQEDGIFYTNDMYKVESLKIYWNSTNGILQYTTNLLNPNWISLSHTNSPNNPYVFYITNAPQAFFRLALDNSIVVPTNPPVVKYAFGNTNTGNNIDTLYDVIPYINFVRHTCLSNVTVTKIFARIPATTGKYKFAIYLDSGSVPNTLLGSTEEVVNPSSDGWYSANLLTAISLSANTDYWIAIWSDSSNGRVYYTDTSKPLKWQGLNYSSWPTTASSTGGSFVNYCLYAE
jgi:hypothetical protein